MRNRRMPNGTYGGVRGRKTKEVGGKLRNPLFSSYSIVMYVFVLFRFFLIFEKRSHNTQTSVMPAKSRYIFFNSRDVLLRVDLSSVVYLEADGNYTRIVLINGLSDMVCVNLGRMEQLLSLRFKDEPGQFARIGKRYIINLNFVYRINALKQELIMSDQRSFSYALSVSKVSLKALKDILSPHK